MRIMGIDPGLKATGFGLVEIKAQSQINCLELGTIEPSAKESIACRIQKIYDGVACLLKERHPDILVLEKLYAHAKHPATAFKLGHVRGAICLLCAQNNLTLVEHSVKRIRKSLVGNGNATKVQTKQVVGHLLGIDVTQISLDATDALALALGHARMMRLNI